MNDPIINDNSDDEQTENVALIQDNEETKYIKLNNQDIIKETLVFSVICLFSFEFQRYLRTTKLLSLSQRL